MESLKEMIEKRAYHLFLKRNGAHGYHMQDWVQAEKEIKAELDAKQKSQARPAVTAKAEPPKAAAAPAFKATAQAAPAAKPKPANKGQRRR
ncbi:MAG: DUF2934 domain-containing protein [Chitinispirillaceae bacterium]|nr:DUF2934 domain-containing protein [Chitinispirillaceae bacterium]